MIVLGAGVVPSLGGAATFEFVAHHRAVAERLAAENERLCRQQRSIAGTLQHALCRRSPRSRGVDVAARSVAGVDELEVSGDWWGVGRRRGSEQKTVWFELTPHPVG